METSRDETNTTVAVSTVAKNKTSFECTVLQSSLAEYSYNTLLALEPYYRRARSIYHKAVNVFHSFTNY